MLCLFMLHLQIRSLNQTFLFEWKQHERKAAPSRVWLPLFSSIAGMCVCCSLVLRLNVDV